MSDVADEQWAQNLLRWMSEQNSPEKQKDAFPEVAADKKIATRRAPNDGRSNDRHNGQHARHGPQKDGIANTKNFIPYARDERLQSPGTRIVPRESLHQPCGSTDRLIAKHAVHEKPALTADGLAIPVEKEDRDHHEEQFADAATYVAEQTREFTGP